MELFPVNIATGKAFCNRDQERKLLKKLTTHGRHTVLIAPRRYGKTSLINQVLLELKFPYCLMELTITTSVEEVEQMMIKHISHLLSTLLPRTTKAKQNLLKLFTWLNPELVLTAGGQKLILHPERAKLSATENISELLKKLDSAAILAKKRVVVVMDEFQQLSNIQGHTVEAAIRHAMQYSKQTSYIFSGSHRNMLLAMFNSKNRPFYNSCEIIKLNRITQEYYEPFIQEAAKARWNKPLSQTALEKIFSLSNCHPSYVNRICGYFWLLNEFPTPVRIEHYWQDFIQSGHAEFTADILSLSNNQKKVIAYLANYPVKHATTHEVCRNIGLPESSIRQALKKLLQGDYLYKDKEDVIRVLDPALRDFLKSFN